MRVLNWDVLATKWAIEQVGKPFVWGETDCVSLMRQMAEIINGEPFGTHRYTSLRGALDVQEATGGICQALRDAGAVEIRRSYATTGDVIVADDEPFPAVLLVITDKALFADHDQGVRLIPLSSVSPDATVYRLG